MKSVTRALVSGCILVSLHGCGGAENLKNDDDVSASAQAQDDGCAGLDVQYLQQSLLAPDPSVANRIQSNMDANEYNRRYGHSELEQRAACEVAKLIRGTAVDLQKSITNMALGFAKKAALAYLDGTTGGLASALFGGGGAPPGPSIADIQNAVRTVINEAFETERRAEFEGHFQAFLQKYENLRALGRQGPEFGHLATLFNELHQPLTATETQRYTDQREALKGLRDEAINILNMTATHTVDGRPNYKVAKPMQLVLGMYASMVRDLQTAGLDYAPSVIEDHLRTLQAMDWELRSVVEREITRPVCFAYEHEAEQGSYFTATCTYKKFGDRIQFDYGLSDLTVDESAYREADHERAIDVALFYDDMRKQYFGDSFDSFLAEMSKLVGKRYGTGIRFEASALPGQFARHQNFLGVLTPTSSLLDHDDSTFKKVAGLAGQCASYESVNFPGYYLRHMAFRVRLDARDGSATFDKDATFCDRGSLSNAAGAVSLESFNFPGRFLRHRNQELWVDATEVSPLFRSDATFFMRAE